MQNIDYQSFVNYAKMRYMAIADEFDVSFDGLSMRGIALLFSVNVWLKTLIFNMLNILYILILWDPINKDTAVKNMLKKVIKNIFIFVFILAQ